MHREVFSHKNQIKNVHIEQNQSGKLTLTCSPLRARVQSCMSGRANNVDIVLVAQISIFQSDNGDWGLAEAMSERKKNHIAALIRLTKRLKGFTAKLITLYPGLDNNAPSCLSEQ